ncbi:SIR2 family protein [Aminobacterium sp. MB27-C1]|uniref:SIR2 family protein n=1 Tax=Aminobacterium sp. MB27-C1 TaxID=3070661 RepID=UPI0027DC93BF|nr:SIR2 family protein [Aminobacterium sp. MB27-C1]WMI72306.1 SIR2 family protein [Aminobacterium sp. MB27-C1]
MVCSENGLRSEKISEEIVSFQLAEAKEWMNIACQENKNEEEKENIKRLKDFLLSSMQMQHVMVLTGSGTSLGEKSGGPSGPSMHDLWEKATSPRNIESKKLDAIFKKINYEEQKEEKNIEDFLSSCESYLQIYKDDYKVRDFLSKAKESIVERCRFETSNEQLNAHITFLHKISRRRGRDSRLKIFTTNYDLCFERAAGALGFVCLNGFSFSNPRTYNPLYFDYDIVRRDNFSNNDSSNYLEGVFKLYKLHGSVNWEREKKKGSVEIIYESDKARAQNICMIFPAKDKYQQSYIQPHLELMARYLSSLRTSNTCLIICGFGFNDDHLSEPIVSAIKTNPHLRVIIVSPHVKEHIDEGCSSDSIYWEKFKTLADENEDITFINANFDSFANLIPDLRALSDTERLAQNIKNLVKSNDER